MGNFAICRLDNVKGHAQSYDFDVAIENGYWAEVDYATNHVVVTTDRTKKQVLVASVPVLYDSNDESDFRNELNTFMARGYTVEVADEFTVTSIDYAAGRANFAAIAVGDYAYAVTGGKTQCDATFPGTTVPAQKFRVIAKTNLNGKDAITLRVEVA